MHKLIRCALLSFVVGSLAIIAACSDNDTPTEPATGSVTVTTVTAGSSLDPDGYQVSVDGTAGREIGVNGTLTLGPFAPVAVHVTLTGVAANCTVVGDNPRFVAAVAGEIATMLFEVTCLGAGSIAVTTVTSGASPDLDGYSVSVAADDGWRIGTNGTLTTEFVVAGTWSVELGGVAANCTVAGDNPRDVTVLVDAVSETQFEVSCTGISVWDRVVFVTDREADGLYDIYWMDADGENPVDLTLASKEYGDPAISPDGTRIAFSEGYSGFGSDIFVINVDGTGQVQLTSSNFDGPENTSPVWSPDGARIAFASDRDDRFSLNIYVMNSDGSGVNRLTSQPGNEYYPCWSPDGTRIVFTTDRDGDSEIYVMNADGTGQTNLTNHPVANDSNPAWSPDGSQIAFKSDRDGDEEIYVMNADGTGQTNLTNHPGSDYAPSWSPDASRISFGTYRDGNGEVYVMNADGSGQVDLTVASSSSEWPGSPQAWR